MLKKIWFQTHWLLGISAGLVLAVVGITGATLSFQNQILRVLNPGVVTVQESSQRALTPVELLARVREAAPDKTVLSVTLSTDPGDAARISFGGGNGPRGVTRYVDPYSGALLGDGTLRGEPFLRLMDQIHRRLAAGEIGKQITGACAIALVILALSGLYLRWPRNAGSWRKWLTLDFSRKGRGFLWDLHAVAGTWALVFYLCAALTGLYWSYDWYRGALYAIAGVEKPAPRAAPGGNTERMNRERPGRDRPGRDRPGNERAAGERPDGQEQRGNRERGAGGATAEAREKSPNGLPDAMLETVWHAFQNSVDDYSIATLRLPERPGAPVQVTYLDREPAHDRAFNRLNIDPRSGAVSDLQRYADKNLGEKFIGSIYPLHTGSFFGVTGSLLMMIASLGMPLFAITGWMLYLERRRKQRAADKAAKTARATGGTVASGDTVLIAFASQSGFAAQLAWQTSASLQNAGVATAVHELREIEPATLGRYKRVLFLVSTFGEGEPPDTARGFARQLSQNINLSDLQFGLLALGDRQYPTFCGFGRQLEQWLFAQGATVLFDTIDVDRDDADALRDWRQRLGELCGTSAEPAWDNNRPWQRWRLAARSHLNPDSLGGPVFHIELEPADGSSAHWRSGDLVELLAHHSSARVAQFLASLRLNGSTRVRHKNGESSLAELLSLSLLPDPKTVPRNATAQSIADSLHALAPRQYSIASIPADGRVHLLVRQAHHPAPKNGDDGELGLASGWLTTHASVGDCIPLRLREHRGFHLDDTDAPLILIGNGTGLAGLRSHLKARLARNQHRNWLIFGERNARLDFYHRHEIMRWRENGQLERLDLAFSRDQEQRVYVQDRLLGALESVRQWVNDGASIYVCGSLEGMAPGVDRALVEILGAEALEQLAANGRYRRDVY